MAIYQSSTDFRYDEIGAWIEKDAEASKPYVIDWYEFLRGNDGYWSANAQVHVNQTYTPSNSKLNNHRYVVVSGGATGNYEPIWPLSPGATVLDGSVLWQEIGLEDTIALSVWALPAGINLVNSGNNSTRAQATISGGVAGTTYNVDNKITSINGVVDSRRFRVAVKDL